MRLFLFFAATLLAACTASDVQVGEQRAARSNAPLWVFDAQVADLRERSCPDEVGFKRPDALKLDVIEAERGTERARQSNLEGLTLSGAWHLKSENDEFGGLSGLDIMRSGSLLAVTDDGKFVWVGIDPDTGGRMGRARSLI